MTQLVPADSIEKIVGASRHPLRHLARAVSAEQTVYILHSARCLASGIDLRACNYSRQLDAGIDRALWADWQDQAVVVHLSRHGLRPDRPAPDGAP